MTLRCFGSNFEVPEPGGCSVVYFVQTNTGNVMLIWNKHLAVLLNEHGISFALQEAHIRENRKSSVIG